MNFLRIHEAVLFAAKVHDGQMRKADPVPFVTHPFTAALYIQPALVREGFTPKEQENIVIAIILHDVWEDTDTTLSEIEERFGQRIMTLVEGASEADKSKSWLDRKTATIEKVTEAPLSLRYVILADKLHNVTSLLDTKMKYGEKIWDSFKANKESQFWYYSSMYKALVEGLHPVPPLFLELKYQIETVFSESIQ
ncbi:MULTISPECIES: HD domain-containing protein [Bacillaceae]|uniref:HD domain-containing protein n=1 Tax=Evansella alkalicola TaxID=745819 RepID=A0ABS6JMZ9_9BACI|nr:HD domain-containing protein [Litchfieldia alkalitelluris]MBU9719938.1 HD domain-containing protein [Bacillus alkalicola]